MVRAVETSHPAAGVGLLTISRPERLNAIDPVTDREMASACWTSSACVISRACRGRPKGREDSLPEPVARVRSQRAARSAFIAAA